MLLDTNYFFSTDIPEFFLSILNSKLFTFYINSCDTPIGNGGAFRHYKYNLEKIHIINFNFSIYNNFKLLIADIISNNSQAAINEINKIIYNLYNLSKEEIEYIEAL